MDNKVVSQMEVKKERRWNICESAAGGGPGGGGRDAVRGRGGAGGGGRGRGGGYFSSRRGQKVKVYEAAEVAIVAFDARKGNAMMGG
ncbi:hypothetical protein EYF80_048866 [Liparis tanakae]|uniref:Uncharacterized protein n=1 Tax=Liparis tanakae TaxID=230148 RepID=A0A4Z2FIC8_9TELE|nr:hypothetical protein EYF80_048866 [Liparis tanakae]